jgi:hypothetical protein
VGVNQTSSLASNTEAMKKIDDFGVDSDQAVETSQGESSQRSRTRCPSLWRGGISAGVERQHSVLAGDRSANEHEAKQTIREHTSEVKMSDVVVKAQQEPD